MDPEKQKLDEIYRLERENNRMLRALRRDAWIAWLFKIALFLVGVGVPIWLYFNYLSPVVQQFNTMYERVSGTSSPFSADSGWIEAYKKFQSFFASSSVPH